MTRPALLVNVARPPVEGDPLDLVRAVLAAGADGVGFADSPRLFGDPWLEAGRALSTTDAALAGPCTVALGLRHPASVAAAVRTLERHHPGRALAVVGRGESSVRNEGVAVPSTAEHAAALAVLAEQLAPAGGERVAPGRVLGAASGPRSIAATAAALGGVLVDVGTEPEVVGRAAAVARDAAPGCRVWLFLRAVVTGSEDESARAAAPLVGSCAARMVAAPSWYGLDDDALAAARTVAVGHDYARHGTADARGDAGEDEATATVRRRFVLAGDAASVAGGARALAGVGVDGVVVAGALAGVVDRLDELVTALRQGFPDRGDSQ